MTSLEQKRQKTKDWKASNKERLKLQQQDYYQANKDKEPKEESNVLRECSCGVAAVSAADLVLFVKDIDSKHGYRNKCLSCSALEARHGNPKKPVQKTCPQCKTTFVGELGINSGFRRAKPKGDKVIGGLIIICKACEFPEELYYEIDGRFIPKQQKEIDNIHQKPQEVL